MPPPETLGEIDFGDDDGSGGESTGAATPDPDGGPLEGGPASDDEPPPPDDGHGGGAGETGETPMADTGEGGGPNESPYQGGWDIGDCQDEIVATGTQVGQVVPDFQLKDQFGDTVRLYDFCHKAVFLTDGAFW